VEVDVEVELVFEEVTDKVEFELEAADAVELETGAILTAAGVLVAWTAATFPAALEVAETERVVSEMTEPVTVALTGTVAVPVTVCGAGGSLATEAADPQSSFWLVHSSKEKPGLEKLTQASN
jgi:hypothetical protein